MLSLLLLIKNISAEGYYCPYPEIGFDGVNDLIYDYYSFDGSNWIRSGEVGWMTRDSYCFAKGDPSQHSDAGEAKCTDSVNKCVWSEGVCISNPTAEPDCIDLCQAVLDGKGLPCLGGGCGDRRDFYAICDGSEAPAPVPEDLPQSPDDVPDPEPSTEDPCNCECQTPEDPPQSPDSIPEPTPEDQQSPDSIPEPEPTQGICRLRQ